MCVYIYRNNNDKNYYITTEKPNEDDNLIIYTEQEDITIPTTRLNGIILRESVIRKNIKEIVDNRRIINN